MGAGASDAPDCVALQGGFRQLSDQAPTCLAMPAWGGTMATTLDHKRWTAAGCLAPYVICKAPCLICKQPAILGFIVTLVR